MSNGDVKSDVLRPLRSAMSSIAFVRVLLWIVAATIIGSMLYLQAMERTRDFAVFKATGTSTVDIGVGLALQAVLLSLAAAVLAALLAVVIAPLFPMPVEIPDERLPAAPGGDRHGRPPRQPRRPAQDGDGATGTGVRRLTCGRHRLICTSRPDGRVHQGRLHRPPARRHVACHVPAGTLALLLGPSGCGKTTLLSCLAAILKPTSGSITFGDTDITALTGRQLTEHRRHGVGVIFQAFNLVPSLNSVENVAVPMRSAGMGGRQAKRTSRRPARTASDSATG